MKNELIGRGSKRRSIGCLFCTVRFGLFCLKRFNNFLMMSRQPINLLIFLFIDELNMVVMPILLLQQALRRYIAKHVLSRTHG